MTRELNHGETAAAHIYKEDEERSVQQKVVSDSSDFQSLMRKETLTKHESTERVFVRKARVLRMRKDHKTLELEAVVSKERFVALRASSCLQVPATDDLVMLQGFEDGSIYVMAVLESAKSKDIVTRIDLPEDSVIGAKSLTFSAGDFTVQSKKFTIATSAYSLKANHASSVTSQYYLSAGNLKQNATKLDIVAQTATSAFTNSIRVVSDTDKVKALNIHYAAQSSAKFLGTTTKINNYEVTVVDGKLV